MSSSPTADHLAIEPAATRGDEADGAVPSLRAIARQARCRDEHASYIDLFFSEKPRDIAIAKAICAGCTVREECLEGALRRREPDGVWGGECFYKGEVVPMRRGRGRPRKHPLPISIPESLLASPARRATVTLDR